jgi:hypothetical protein
MLAGTSFGRNKYGNYSASTNRAHALMKRSHGHFHTHPDLHTIEGTVIRDASYGDRMAEETESELQRELFSWRAGQSFPSTIDIANSLCFSKGTVFNILSTENGHFFWVKNDISENDRINWALLECFFQDNRSEAIKDFRDERKQIFDSELSLDQTREEIKKVTAKTLSSVYTSYFAAGVDNQIAQKVVL